MNMNVLNKFCFGFDYIFFSTSSIRHEAAAATNTVLILPEEGGKIVFHSRASVSPTQPTFNSLDGEEKNICIFFSLLNVLFFPPFQIFQSYIPGI